jgi:hypothetical protein
MTSTKLTSEQKPKQLVDVDELARISQHHASNFQARSFASLSQIMMMQHSRKVLTENKHDLRNLKLACDSEISKIKRVSQVEKNRIIIEKMQREEFPLSFSEIDEM